jgi:hypothetical protein
MPPARPCSTARVLVTLVAWVIAVCNSLACLHLELISKVTSSMVARVCDAYIYAVIVVCLPSTC